MASNVPHPVGKPRKLNPIIGRQILDVITSGMYSDPRMAIREYIQNATDSIDAAISAGLLSADAAEIAITIDGRTRSIVVQDNGTGLSPSNAESRLVNLGCSTKMGSGYRGFRGIGRLGGISYCDVLRFETRSTVHDPVTVIEWAGESLSAQVDSVKGHENIISAVRRITSVHTRKVDKLTEPAHFFRVTMTNVHRFHSDSLMNIKDLREYLAQTAPVPYDSACFSFKDRITSHLSSIPGYRSYRITLNGIPLFRPYADVIALRKGMEDRIADIELLELIAPGNRLVCRGWYAKTNFLSAIPPHISMRGIRIRQGNIGVGDEDFLKSKFTEPRFATWHIGELHVGDGLKLNARRDGFEATHDYELLLEWASRLCRQLSLHCRESSKTRSAEQSRVRAGEYLDQLFNTPFFIDSAHKTAILDAARQGIDRLVKANVLADGDLHFQESRLDALRLKSSDLKDFLDRRKLKKDPSYILVDLSKHLREALPGPDGVELLNKLLLPYCK